jgi:4-hydroxybutyryl-CoA dehydratase/vinylacetyl-CoA-Delta-isomerase
MFKISHEVSGGILVTSPYPEDMKVPDVKERLSRYLKGRDDISADHRLKIARLLEDITASYQGGWYSMISIHGGGSPEAGRIEIMRKYDLEERKSLVERITGIKKVE